MTGVTKEVAERREAGAKKERVMTNEELVSDHEMLSIVASGGNGSEYVDMPSLIENACIEYNAAIAQVTALQGEVERLRAALRPFARRRPRGWPDCRAGRVCEPLQTNVFNPGKR